MQILKPPDDSTPATVDVGQHLVDAAGDQLGLTALLFARRKAGTRQLCAAVDAYRAAGEALALMRGMQETGVYLVMPAHA